MSFETLLFLLAVALVVWANFVKPLLRRRGPRGRGRGAPERPAPGSVPGSPPESTSDALRGPEPEPIHGSPPRWPPGTEWGRGGADDGPPGRAEGASLGDRDAARRAGREPRRAPAVPRHAPQAPRRAAPPRPSPGPGVVPRAAELRRLSPADLRGIVVLTTVLGPCRALDDARRDPTRPD